MVVEMGVTSSAASRARSDAPTDAEDEWSAAVVVGMDVSAVEAFVSVGASGEAHTTATSRVGTGTGAAASTLSSRHKANIRWGERRVVERNQVLKT